MAQRVAILTGGGDCPGLNAVIRAVAKTAILEHGAEVIGIEDGFEGLIHGRLRPLDYLSVSGILTQGGTILGTSNRANPFCYPVEGGGEARYEDVSQRVVATFRSIHADALVVIGGDGSLTIASQLCELGVPCVGVPKTIDNDLFGTDQTFGFDSALVTATEAADKLHTTAQAHHRVMILEVMGRNAGWLALGTGVAGGGDIILIPEIPYRLEAVRDYILKRLRGRQAVQHPRRRRRRQAAGRARGGAAARGGRGRAGPAGRNRQQAARRHRGGDRHRDARDDPGPLAARRARLRRSIASSPAASAARPANWR